MRLARPTIAALLASVALLGVARAHVTPPVRLLADREVVTRLLDGAPRVSVREVRISAVERAAIERETDWNPRDAQRAYVGRDASGQLVGFVIFVSEHTMHGHVRVAVGLDPDGRITGANVVELSEETYSWIRPLIEHDFVRDHVGKDARGNFAPSDRLERAVPGAMPRFYGRVLTRLLHRAAAIVDVGILAQAR